MTSFSAATTYATGDSPRSLTSGDFNGDGKPDLAVANQGNNNVSVLLNNGNGGFGTATNYAVGIQPYYVVSADFNSPQYFLPHNGDSALKGASITASVTFDSSSNLLKITSDRYGSASSVEVTAVGSTQVGVVP